MSYQLGDRDLALIADVSRKVNEEVEKFKQIEEGHKMRSEDQRSDDLRQEELSKRDKEVSDKLEGFLREIREISTDDPQQNEKLFEVMIKQKQYLEKLLKERKVSNRMRELIHGWMHTGIKDYLSGKNNNVISTKMI
jgi:hypothetical protein